MIPRRYRAVDVEAEVWSQSGEAGRESYLREAGDAQSAREMWRVGLKWLVLSWMAIVVAAIVDACAPGAI